MLSSQLIMRHNLKDIIQAVQSLIDGCDHGWSIKREAYLFCLDGNDNLDVSIDGPSDDLVPGKVD